MLAEEAGMLVLCHQGKKPVNCADLRCGWIGMPLQVRSHPEHLPKVCSSDKRSLRDRLFHGLARSATPPRTNLKDLNALPINAIRKIQFMSDVWRRAMLFDELSDSLFHSLGL